MFHAISSLLVHVCTNVSESFFCFSIEVKQTQVKSSGSTTVGRREVGGEMVVVGVVEFVPGRVMNIDAVVNTQRRVRHRHMAITLLVDARHLQVAATCSFC